MNKLLLLSVAMISLLSACTANTPSQTSYKPTEVGKLETLQNGTVTAVRQVSIVKDNSLGTVVNGVAYGFVPTGDISEYTINTDSKKIVVVTQWNNLTDKKIVANDTVGILTGDYSRVMLVNHPEQPTLKVKKHTSHNKKQSSKTKVDPCANAKPVTAVVMPVVPVTAAPTVVSK